MSKTWGAIGAWAAEAEREEAEEKALAAAAAEAGGGAGNFPSLKEASSTKQKKKKMTLQEFTMQQTPARSKGLTPDEMLRLPTGPTQRAPGDEMPFGRLGGGFSNYGRRDREEGDRGGRRSYGGGFDEDRRGGAPPRVSDFDQPSRADEADNWAMGKKTSSIPLPSNRYSGLGGGGGGGGGMGMGMSRADEVDNWGAGKKPVAPVRSSTFGSSFRDSRPEPDRWSSRGGFGGGFGEGGEREVQSERRKLVLDPPRREGLGGEVVEQVKASSNKPNPFGTARPREEVLAEKGLDWKKVDLEIEAKKSSSSRPASEHSSRPSSAQSSRSEGLGLQGVEGGGVVKPRPKVNPFGDAKPREVLLQEKGMDWRKIDLDLEHRRVDRPETEAEKNLKEEIELLKKELEKESSSHENHEPLEGPGDDKTNLRDQILIRQKDLELLTRELDDKVSFGQKAIERPGSGAGRVSSFPERPPSQSGAFEEPRSVEYMDRPRSRGTGDMWSRQGDDRRSFQGGRERGFLGNRDMDRIDEPTELHEMDLDESNNNATSVNRKLANARHLRQLRSGFPTPDEQNLSAPDPKSRGEEDSEPLQLQLHQYSDATIGISQHGSTSGTASERGVLSMEESIRLKELEETPSNPRELEQLNCDPMEVPPTISRHFSILCVLDLSYSEINSLPQSISILVALQKLYLRSCELLMELPPEIGELTNLKVLDLEGTEILYLPKEIAKLVNLTCLKVSFYGYANQRVIPLGVLPNLSRLIELIIDVTPYGAWWDDEVKDITDDLFSLDDLRTLKLYFPTAELLEGLTRVFSGLANFRFTVGRHEEHFISRLPHDVEEEFNNREKMERGLKFINGNHIPNEITKVLKHANAFVLQRHWTAKSLSDFGHENMNEVKFCLVTECNEFRTIIDSEQFYRGKDEEDFQDSDDVIALGLLEKLIVRFMKNIVSIWNGPVGKGCLSNLKSLALHTCPSLTTLFTIDMLSNLIYLEELVVEDCPKINSLVSLNSSSSESGLFLPNMKKISLLELPELVSISSGLCIAPKLERMVIFYCPKLEKLSTMDVSSTNLKVIKGEKEWWDALKWYESDLSTKHEDHLASIFIPLRRDGDLMAQLTKD